VGVYHFTHKLQPATPSGSWQQLLSGHLHSSVTNLLTSLQTLFLGDHKIFGAIPFDISNLVGLNILEMANFSQPGVIPEIIGKLNNLVDFGLHNTGLSGFIRFSRNLTQLSGLYVYYGNLEGPIPPKCVCCKCAYLVSFTFLGRCLFKWEK
jgi:hypothetical protein